MTATTMQFGPEWMRTKLQTPRSQAAPSPPPPTSSLPAASSYSSLVTPAPHPPEEKRDASNPFKYSKEDMLRIYKEGGGRGGLGLEVERWDGIVREVGSEPAVLREWTEAEKKLFAGSLNSEIRRRQSTDYVGGLSTTTPANERPRLSHNGSGGASPLRERFGSLMGRRRDSTDQQPSPLLRKLSTSALHGSLNSPRDNGIPSPRARIGFSPGFDGVLNGGDSWNLRRRNSEGPLRAGNASNGQDHAEHQSESHRADIKEEEENGNLHGDEMNRTISSAFESESAAPVAQDIPLNDTVDSPPRGVNLSTADSSTSASATEGIPGSNVGLSLKPPGPPPGHSDLASIEWSYLDPQQQVQGPFRADLMQKWHDEGYFTPDLLMKRTHLDSEWTSVSDLTHRARGGQIFLTPSVHSAAPPGLARRSTLVSESFPSPREPVAADTPYQPVPMRSLHSTTLDSYLNGSTPASPSSSFDAARFGTGGSPDPGSFGVKIASNLYSPREPSLANRVGGLSTGRDPSTIFEGQSRNNFNDPTLDPSFGARSSPFERTMTGRTSSMDNFGYGDLAAPRSDPNNAFTSGFSGPNADQAYTHSGPLPSGLGNLRGPVESTSASGFTSPGAIGIPYSNQRPLSHLARDAFARHSLGETQLNGHANVHGAPSFASPPQNQSFPHSPSSSFIVQQQPQSLPPVSTPLVQGSVGSPSSVNHQPQNLQHSFLSTPNQVAHSSWGIQDSAPSRRPNPFDAPHPKTGNTIVNAGPSGAVSSNGSVTPSHPPRWVPTNTVQQPQLQLQTQPSPGPSGRSPWYTASRGIVEDGWGDMSAQNRLTFSNLMQHNEQQRQKDGAIPKPLEPYMTDPTLGPEHPVPAVDKQQAQKKSSQTTPRAGPVQPPKQPSVTLPAAHTALVSPSSAAPPSAVPTPTKPAWSLEEEKVKPSGVTMGLREIQDAETKKVDARKAVDKERERTARATPAAVIEDVQTLSWGLPTSQAGAARNPSQNVVKDSASVSASGSAAIPWTNTAKSPATKKTMKEIQEEEERRKKDVKQKETVAVAARRAYAETTTKVVASATAAAGAWATVGPGGKVGTPVAGAALPVRPSVPSTLSTPALSAVNVVPRPANGISGSSRPHIVPSATISKPPPASKADDTPAPPSHELLKWLGDSLKGLNTSVNLEEIISMLLSFPVDPDPSTLELISDLIYANSTTMDGRRFATEFVSRRKLDTGSRMKGATGKGLSIADVVKAQPKPAQNDGWGGFKVVNKKKKNGK